MGCDFFYDGYLPDENLQKKLINFVKDYFRNIDLMITPDTNSKFLTEFHFQGAGPYYNPRTEQYEKYPFNYFGFIPFCKDEDGISDLGQFIFNRNDNGRLVKIRRLPDLFGVIPHRYFQDEVKIEDDILKQDSPMNLGRAAIPELLKVQENLSQIVVPYKYQVVLDDGGYHRGGGLDFALLLTICKLRWWPDLKIGDDYENCETVDVLLDKYTMRQQLIDESLDFHACYSLFISEYDKDFPPPPSTGSRDDRIKANAQWYLDFMAKIKPFLKDREKDGADTTTQSESAEILGKGGSRLAPH